MNTQQYQQLILELIKEQPPSVDHQEPYVDYLTNSIELEVARSASIWWRSLQIEKYCLITANYLKFKSCFHEVVSEFYRKNKVSPNFQQAGELFLKYQQKSNDPLLICIASFEDYLKRLKMGDTNNYTIFWDYEPYQLMDILIEGKPLNLNQLKGSYQMNISHTLKDQFIVIDLNQDPDQRKN